MKRVEILLPYPPSNNHYKRHRGGQYFLTAQAKRFHREVAEALAKAGNPSFGDVRLKVRLEVRPPDRRRRDLDNVPKVLFDALQRSGLFDDDSQIDDYRVRRDHPTPGGMVLVTVMDIVEEDGL